MSRRDTIIVAVLINAGLLIVLFASALKSGGPSQEMAASSQNMNMSQVDMAFQKDASHSNGDEVDQVLSQFSQPAPVQSPIDAARQLQSAPIAAQITQPIASAIPVQNSFAEDLQAISSPQESAPAIPSLQHAASSASAAQSEFIEVKVKKGDILEKIARQNKTTVAEIMKCNKLATTNLKIGQTLKIPNKSGQKAAPSTIAAPSTASSSASSAGATKLYTIKNGDNPWTIAVKHHMKVDELLKLNNLDQEKARRLKPGDQIRVR